MTMEVLHDEVGTARERSTRRARPTIAASAAPQLGIEAPRTTPAVVHRENVDEVLADRVVDAVGKAMEAGATNSIVRDDARLGMPRYSC